MPRWTGQDRGFACFNSGGSPDLRSAAPHDALPLAQLRHLERSLYGPRCGALLFDSVRASLSLLCRWGLSDGTAVSRLQRRGLLGRDQSDRDQVQGG
jgi:hypothetical protein